jgi:archaellum component FlaC
MQEMMVGLATQLATLVGNETATAINSKIAAMKTEKDIGKVRQNYEDILNGLLSERSEAIRIAQTYKEELEKVEISDKDIEHLHNTVERLIEIFKGFLVQQNNGEDNQEIQEEIKSFEQVKELISVDTLKTMQLLGFNYKQAIGDPLTIILRNFILSKVPTNDDTETFHKMITPEMVEILKNNNAYAHFKDWLGNTSQN